METKKRGEGREGRGGERVKKNERGDIIARPKGNTKKV